MIALFLQSQEAGDQVIQVVTVVEDDVVQDVNEEYPGRQSQELDEYLGHYQPSFLIIPILFLDKVTCQIRFLEPQNCGIHFDMMLLDHLVMTDHQ